MSQSTKTQTFDVFLSLAASEVPRAAEVAKQLRQQGLETFSAYDLEADANVEDAVWEALAESVAVIAFLPSDGPTANMTFEIGAAKAWHKPIFAIASDLTMSRLNAMFRNAQLFPISRVDDIARAIKAGQVLTDADRRELVSAYTSTQIPVDQLFTDPVGLESLVQSFHQRTGKVVAGELLLSDLLRMRKQGQLKPLRVRRRPRQNAAGKA